MKLKIEKERVLEAAKFGAKTEALLKTLFPEAFEEDTLAIKDGVFDGADDLDLSNFCRKAFGDPRAIKIAIGAPSFLDPERPDLRGRSLYVPKGYDVEILNVDTNYGTIIVFKHKK